MGDAIRITTKVAREIKFARYRYQPWTLPATLHTIRVRNRLRRSNPHVRPGHACGRGTRPAPPSRKSCAAAPGPRQEILTAHSTGTRSRRDTSRRAAGSHWEMPAHSEHSESPAARGSRRCRAPDGCATGIARCRTAGPGPPDIVSVTSRFGEASSQAQSASASSTQQWS